MGPDGEPTGLPARVAAEQLRPFDMTRTSPVAEWRRLHRQTLGPEIFPTRAVVGHRDSERDDASPTDLEFLVVWITDEGDVPTWEPARHLSAMGNVHFKDYLTKNRLISRVRAQVTRERASTADG
jgi:hypothetical protein